MHFRLSKTLKRLVRDALFLHIFIQDGEKLKETTSTVFFVSHALLMISVIILTTLELLILFDHGPGQYIFKMLDDFMFVATCLLLFAAFLATVVKIGAFEKYWAHLVWICFMFILVSVLMMFAILFNLVFESRWLLDAFVATHALG